MEMRVPEQIEKFRLLNHPQFPSNKGDDFGAFIIPGLRGRDLMIIASPGSDEIPFEHVSVSLPTRCPNWPEMCFVKDMFWSEEEAVMQLHPPKSDYISYHPYCLHLWRPLKATIPLPPWVAVGPREKRERA